MINEEKVKQLYKVALYEQKEEKRYRQIGKYYRNDYIAKELIKSIFTGTIAYFFMSALWIARDWQGVLDQVAHLGIAKMLIPVMGIYVVFMAIYLTVTYLFYKGRYEDCIKGASDYEAELSQLNEMYEQEEK